MAACRRKNNWRNTAGRSGRTAPADTHTRETARTPSAAEPAVRRYIHPICAGRPPRRSPEGELLLELTEELRRQSQLLEELLRRTGGNNAETN